ncbi:unnamed protein product, partial [Adineta steineri]
MNDENHDISSTQTKLQLESVDNQSSIISSESTDKTNVSQDIPLTSSAEISVKENLPTDGKYASVSILDEPRRHTISYSRPSKYNGSIKNQSNNDMHNTKHDLAYLLGSDNDHMKTKNLNPDAPDFKPTDFKPRHPSDFFVSAHTKRRATHTDSYDDRHPRTRNHSETQQRRESLTSIKPLLSIVPQYIPPHRHSWNPPEPLLSISRSRSQPSDYSTATSDSRRSSLIYSPLMEQVITLDDDDENHFSFNQQQHKQVPNRPRTNSGRALLHLPNQSTYSRQRSHSGPEPSLQAPPSHLKGIHSLTRIMIDLLRLIKPISEQSKQDYESILLTNLDSNSSIQQSSQSEEQGNKTSEVEGDFIDENKSTTPSSSLRLPVDDTAGVLNEDKNSSTNFNDNEPEHKLPLISFNRNENKIASIHSAPDEPFNENTNEKKIKESISTSIIEPSTEEEEDEEDEEEKSSNRSRHMAKKADDEEQHRQQQQQQQHQQSNSTISSEYSTGSSKYFDSISVQKKELSKKSTEIVEEQQMNSQPLMKNEGCSNNRPSSMNILHSNIDDGLMREKQREKENLPIEHENCVREKNEQNDEQMCTINLKDGKNDKEIKSSYFMRSIAGDNNECTKNSDTIDEKIPSQNDFSSFTTIPTSSDINYAEHELKQNNNVFKEKDVLDYPLIMNVKHNYVPSLIIPTVNKTTSMSPASPNTITSTNNNNKWDEQDVEAMLSSDERAAMTTANVDDGGENRRDREKGEREKREDNIKRTLTSTTTREEEKTEERERARQANKNTDSVTSFTSEQHSCPSVVRLSVDDSMANRVSASYTRNNPNQNTSSSNNRSSRSTLTTHTYASTNTYNTEPTYTTTRISGDPRTLHSYYLTSSNYRPPSTSPVNSLTRRHHYEHEPSYPSISRYRTPSSSSPYRKTHYLDDSDEEIINEEILEITDLNHYPTLIERWGDDTKTIVRQEGELKIEDFVEFEETEPTVVEEILYELVYSGDNLKTCRQIHRSRSESRNFRRIKKRRTKRKLHQNDDSSYITSQATSRDTSGTRSPYYQDNQYSPERSITPTQSTLSTSWQSTGFLSPNKLSLDIPIRDRTDENNYVNNIRVNESQPYLSHSQIQQYPPTTRIRNNNNQYETSKIDSNDKQTTELVDEMRYLSNQIDTLITADDDSLIETDKYTPIISEKKGITKIKLTPTIDEETPENFITQRNLNEIKDTNELFPVQRNENLLTTTQTTDDKEQSRINIIEQTSLQKEISRKQSSSLDNEKQINETISSSKFDESEKDDEEHSSTTGPTVQEFEKDEQTTGKDTDEDASFSESEQISLNSSKSDRQKQSYYTRQISDESLPLSSTPTNIEQIQRKSISKAQELLINELDELESELKSLDPQRTQSSTLSDHEELEVEENLPDTEHRHTTDDLQSSIPEYHDRSEPTDEEGLSTSETDEDLRSFLNSLTAHLMPGLPMTSYEDETEDELSFMSETKSSEEPSSYEDQLGHTNVHQTIQEVTEEFSESDDHVDHFETKTEDQTAFDILDSEHDNEEKSSSIVDTIDSTVSNSQKSTTEETPESTDSLTNVTEQIRTEITKKFPDQNNQERISRISVVTTDKTSPTILQSKQITSEDTHDIIEKLPSNIDSLTRIYNQIKSQPVQSSFKEQKIITDTHTYSQPSIEQEQDKLTSVDFNNENTQPITTSTLHETIERRKSINRQPSSELHSTAISGEQVPSDSLVDIVRQINTIPQITRLPFTDNKTETTQIIEQEFEKPSTDSRLEIVQTIESIPNEPVTKHEEQQVVQTTDIKDVLPEITQEVETPLASQLPSDYITTESIISTDKQDENLTTHDNIDTQHILSDVPFNQTAALTKTEKHVNDELISEHVPAITQIAEQITSENRRLSDVDKVEEVEAERLSSNALTEVVHEILSTPTTIYRPTSEDKTHTLIESEVHSFPSTPVITLEEKTLQKTNEPEITPDNKEQLTATTTTESELEKTKEIDEHYQEKPSIENLTRIIHEQSRTPDTDTQPDTYSILKTIERATHTITPDDYKKETEHISTTISEDEVSAISPTLTTVRQPSFDVQEAEKSPTQTFTESISSITTTTPDDQVTHVSGIETTSTIKTLDEEPVEDTTKDIQPEQLSSQALTETMREILATSRSTHIPATHISTESSAKISEDQMKEIEADHVSSEAITQAVREILAAPQPRRSLPVDSTTKTTTEVTTEEALKPTEQLFTSVSEVQTHPQEELQQDVDQHERSSTVQRKYFTKVIPETQTEDEMKQTEAEHLSVNALTEAVRDILTTSHISQKPTTKVAEEKLQQPATELSSSIFTKIISTQEEQLPQQDTIKLASQTSSTDETVKETAAEERERSAQDKMKEAEAEHISSEAIIEAVRDILATPLNKHQQPADVKVEQQTDTIQEAPMKSAEELSTSSFEQHISKEQEKEQKPVTHDEQHERETVKEISPIAETVEETTTEDQMKKAQAHAEHVSSEAITEAVREILATPLTKHERRPVAAVEESILR